MAMYFRPRHLLLALVLGLGVAGCGGESSGALLDKARQSLDAGDRKAATIHLKSAIQADENNAEARFELGRLQLEAGAFASAEKELRRARQAGYPPDTVNPLLAKALLGQSDFKRVIEEITPPAEGSPAEVPVLVVRATAQLNTGETEEARKSLARATAIAPKDADVLLAQARLALADGDPAKAAAHIDEALQIDPRHRDGWLFKGDLLRMTGKPAEAARAYEAALRLDPEHESGRLALASIAIADNRLADARREVDRVLKASHNNLKARYTLALINFREKKHEAARDNLARVLKSAPDYLPATLLAGAVEYELGNMQSAETHLNKVIKVMPRNLHALRLLAAAQLRQGRLDDASRTLATVPDTVNDAGYHVVAGEVALARKDFSAAASHFEKAAQISPASAAIRTELGMARLAQGDARAMADLQAAAGMEGSSGRADSVIILSQLRQQEFDAALATIAALEKKQGPSPLTWNYRGAAEVGKKDLVRARASFAKALQLDPAFFPAASNLAQLDLKDKQPAAARKRFEDVLKADPKHLNAMLALAGLSLNDRDEKGYVAWLEKAAKAHPQALQPRLAMARHMLGKGNRSQALAVAREAVDAQPNHPAALDLLGSVQLALGDTANAVSTFRKLVEASAEPAVPLLKLATAQVAAQQQGDARKSLLDAVRAQPDLLEAQLMLGRLDIQGGRHDDALKLARQIQQQKPKSSAGAALEGEVALARKQFDAALTAYERAHALEPAGVLLIRQHAALAGLGRPEEGEKRLAAWVAHRPKDVETRIALAERLIQRQQYKAASEHYLALNRSNPGNVVVLNNLAWALFESGDTRALGFAEQAHKLQPDSASVMDTLGWILVAKGQAPRGLRLLQQALSKQPDAAEIHWHLAAGYARSGDRDRAKSELQRLLASGLAFSHEDEARRLLNQLQGQTR